MTNNIDSINNWDDLPDIALSRVFKHLCDQDRFSASLVSRSWSEAFRSPEIWNKLKFEVPRPPSILDEKPFNFVESVGTYLKELEINYNPFRGHVESLSLHNFMAFLLILTRKSFISLKTFILTNLQLRMRWRDDWRRTKVLKLIQKFLGTQSNLTRFDMARCDAYLGEGVQILSHLTQKNSRSLMFLNLTDYFNHRSEVLSSPEYQNVMESFKNLVQVSINYSFIDSNILRKMAENCKGSLKLIEIHCFEGNQIAHEIKNATWEWVSKTCPQLEVHVNISEVSVPSNYAHIICSEMRLHSFILTTDNIPAEDKVGIAPLVKQLFNFGESLEKIYFDYICDHNFDDKLLIELITSCPKLKCVRLTGTTSLETVKKLCEMHLERTIHLESCFFTISDVNDDELTIASLKEMFALNESLFDRKVYIDYHM